MIQYHLFELHSVSPPISFEVTFAAGANTPLPYNTLDVDPSKFTVAMLPIPTTFATATLFATVA
jgi:hypothetical protein